MAAKFEVGKTYKVEGVQWKGIVTITSVNPDEREGKFGVKILKLETDKEHISEFFSHERNHYLWGDGDEWDAKPYTLQLENK